MNLLILSQHFYPERFQSNMFAQALLKKGHQVTVLTAQPNYPEGKTFKGYKSYLLQKEIWQGITIYHVPLIPRGNGNNLKLFLNYFSYMFSSCFFSLFLKRKKFDACFAYQTSPIFQSTAGVVLKKVYKIPFYLWVQDLWPESLSATKRMNVPMIEKIIRKFTKLVYKQANVIFMQSEAFEQSIKKTYPVANPIFLPNTCDDIYQPVNQDNIKPIEGMHADFKVIFTGNIGAAQAIPTIIEAAKLLHEKDQSDIRWIIVGTGSELENAKALVEKYNVSDQVVFLGSYPVTDMPNIIAQADLCLATLNKSDIFSLTVPAKIQSYMACAKPIVTAIDGEVKRIIAQAKCGIAVASEDSVALADAVLKMKSMSETERKQMGDSGKKYFDDNYQSEKVIGRLCSVLENGD